MIRVLCVNIARATEADYRRLYALASRERRERADRYLRREDALRCVTAGALLRYVAGGNVAVARTPAGKPYFPDKPDLHFSLTHSGDFVGIAHGDSPVGMDIEQIREIRPEIARRFFTPAEQAFADSPERFFQIWSMKESYSKFLGTGLTYPMQVFDVLSEPLSHGFYTDCLPGHALAVYSPELAEKWEEIPLFQLISPADML